MLHAQSYSFFGTKKCARAALPQTKFHQPYYTYSESNATTLKFQQILRIIQRKQMDPENSNVRIRLSCCGKTSQ